MKERQGHEQLYHLPEHSPVEEWEDKGAFQAITKAIGKEIGTTSLTSSVVASRHLTEK